MTTVRPMAMNDGFDDGFDDGSAPRRWVDGRKRILLSLALLVMIVTLLVFSTPIFFRPTHRAPALLPGLTLEDTAHPAALFVTSVQSNSIPDDAGIMAGDKIVSIDAQRVASRADIKRYLDLRHPMVVDMQLARGSKPVELTYVFPQSSSL